MGGCAHVAAIAVHPSALCLSCRTAAVPFAVRAGAAAAQAQDNVQRYRRGDDAAVEQRAPVRIVVELVLARKDEALLLGRNAFLVLDLGFDVLDAGRWLNVERNGPAGERLGKDLHR